eukprot:TRINITY_DN7197_c0_g1_i1.p2 TRINITY_DN7197_c0_g1~~TRINITY_DN7197_c0_g1_i1.p2  ORF type:complete len:57 (+),score=6.16 TRINITY_DN7197_c0_g1_i1:261-431(+)
MFQLESNLASCLLCHDTANCSKFHHFDEFCVLFTSAAVEDDSQEASIFSRGIIAVG